MSEASFDRLQAILTPLRPQRRQATGGSEACGCNPTARGLGPSAVTTTIRKREVSMATETIEILPKTALRAAMTQSPEQAIDVGQHKTGLLQAWVDAPAGDTVALVIQQANLNEDSAFEDVAGMTLSLDSTEGFATAGESLGVAVAGRYIRLKITPTYAMGVKGVNVRAVLHLNRD